MDLEDIVLNITQQPQPNPSQAGISGKQLWRERAGGSGGKGKLCIKFIRWEAHIDLCNCVLLVNNAAYI